MVRHLSWIFASVACAALLGACSDDSPIVDQGNGKVLPAARDAGPGGNCGDRIVQSDEECEPPGTESCDAKCRLRSNCGDGVLDEGEECDDGNLSSGDGCSGTCQAEFCGNGRLDPGETCERPNEPHCDGNCQHTDESRCGDGLLDPGEECEDANAVTGDGCSEHCQLEVCGNGRIDPGEACDPPGSDTCDANCQIRSEINPGCGNGMLDPGEECEDSNTVGGDGCTAKCLVESCGNHRLDPGEVCEPPSTAFCDAHCQPLSVGQCGDRKLQAGEACDDGNRANGDGCSSVCAIERCGNNVLDVGEECEPPDPKNQCSSACQRVPGGCGNGVVDKGEECEDGNVLDGDGCDHACRREGCGNGRLDPGEECDSPDVTVCTSSCRRTGSSCGNGIRELAEECDDGNRVSGDGCNGSCLLESCGNQRVDFTGECEPPNTVSCDSRCRPTRAASCGNGTVDSGEECEDGNLINGDGCSERCQLERCGNGRVDFAEECEPPNTAICSRDCRLLERPSVGGTSGPPTGVLLSNGGFDRDVSSWSPRAQVATVTFDTEHDSGSASTSGAAKVVLQYQDQASGSAPVQGGISQCVALQPSTAYQLDARYLLDASSPPSAQAALRVAFFSDATCAGAPVSAPVVGDTMAVRGAWTDLQTVRFDTPAAAAGVRGVGVFVELRKAFADPPASALVDQVVLSLQGSAAVCGDGLVSSTEACEPSLTSNCTADCHILAVCGDRVVTSPEECDPPDGTQCGAQCFRVRGFCGNGVREGSEECDPPNGTTCGLACTSISCGNGKLEAPEECEPPGSATCDTKCQKINAVCGDGIVQGSEQCDPPDPRAECSATCRRQAAVCGNGTVEAREDCDPPSAADHCEKDCKRSAWCGDGIIQGAETCDPPDAFACGKDCQVLASKQCEGCLARQCGTRATGTDMFGACYSATGNATSGPAAGTARAKLCADAVSCMVKSGCAQNGVASCYCGQAVVDQTGKPLPERVMECREGLRQPLGACVAEFERAGESTVAGDVMFDILLGAERAPSQSSSDDSALSAASALLTCGMETRFPASAPPQLGACNVSGACQVTASCGNGILEVGEECDDGNADEKVCTSACKLVACGNGVVDTDLGEECDTADLLTSARCDKNCKIKSVCGDGLRDGLEECDPADPTPPPPGAKCCGPQDASCAACKWIATCGNAKIEPPKETCEPPGTATCDATCHTIDVSPCSKCMDEKAKDPDLENIKIFRDTCANDPDLGPQCQAVSACVDRTHCGKADPAACICGTDSSGSVNVAACLGAPVPPGPGGQCFDVVLAQTRQRGGTACDQAVNPMQCLLSRYQDTDFGTGIAFQLLLLERQNCALECGLDP